MKTYIITITVIIGVLFRISPAISQGDPIKEALSNEIARSMEGLHIDKMLPPKYISFTVTRANTLQIKASMGGLVYSKERSLAKFNNRVLVGEEGKTNENYLDENNMWSWNSNSNSIPLDAKEEDVRRALWLTADYNYKTALTNYQAQRSAISQQRLPPEETDLSDFSDAGSVEYSRAYSPMVHNKQGLEDLARELSSVFSEYPLIQESQVLVSVFDAEVFFANSEGSQVNLPFQIVAVKVIASAQLPTGEILNDHAVWYFKNLEKLPNKTLMLDKTKLLAVNLSALVKAPRVDEPYCGPVLFEGEAAAEMFLQLFFYDVNGLMAKRKPILGNEEIAGWYPERTRENKLEAMMGKKIVSRDITIEAVPQMKEYLGIPLIGTLEVDCEGVKTSGKVSLVDKGVLTGLLSTRTPTRNMKQSNGHACFAISGGEVVAAPGPSVIMATNSNPETSADKKKMKEMLIAEAKEEDLPYAYIVRKILSPSVDFPSSGGRVTLLGSGGADAKSITPTVEVYRVNVKDGSEELVSLAEIQGLSIKSFKRLLATSKDMQVYNTMCRPGGSGISNYGFDVTGIPTSIIVPQAFLFEELDVVKETQDMVKKPPVVTNPVAGK
ncbi:MAG: metallopeptidase TldD-related protein [Bacteroidota bacterium]